MTRPSHDGWRRVGFALLGAWLVKAGTLAAAAVKACNQAARRPPEGRR
ncbi:hypothetical protein [Methylobacterium frigidaeris]|uniref:Uncharacterized protein n=1 Tax=Methylobacterium frigidaeris TaxID=2038277 RepID=A0AA37M806_9HYPH|nr:hypothetical protein [Methylobacterium frigidaeris]GJD66430.1 hypothetical protein MPEAHAMD_6628 [Methylobacterium frigidaeris]